MGLQQLIQSIGLRRVLSATAQKLGSWIEITFETRTIMYTRLRLFCVGMLPYSDKGLTKGWSCFYGILPNGCNSNLVKIEKKTAGTLHKYLPYVTVCRWIILGIQVMTVGEIKIRFSQTPFLWESCRLRITKVWLNQTRRRRTNTIRRKRRWYLHFG